MKVSRRTALKQGTLAGLAAVSGSALFEEHLFGAAASAAPEPTRPGERMQVREIYCPAHFGNSYEAMWPREMKAYLAELKFWGFNRYSDWITTTDICSPYASGSSWDLGREQLERKKTAFRAAQDLGLGLNLIITPNHVYLNQLRAGLSAVKQRNIIGQLICPGKPEARKIILENAEHWFGDMAQSGIRLNALTAFAYDYGGCACEQCKPWILTFAKLTKEIHAIAEHHHPGIEPWFCSWWWSAAEHELVNKWADEEAPGWLKGITLHIEYNQTRFKEVAVPKGCRKIAFVHNGYSDTRASGDVYCKFGPTIAPERLPTTLNGIAAQGAAGFQAYSEGVFDDVNKAILGGLSSGKFATVQEVLNAYATRYFDAKGDQANRWVDWLSSWGDRRKVVLPKAADEFAALSAGLAPTWRLEHWRSKLKLEQLDRAIGKPKPDSWTSEKLELADQYWAEQEHMLRDVYMLGPVRHVFARTFLPPAWYDSWQKATGVVPKQGATRSQA